LAALAGAAVAQPVVDGSRVGDESFYDSALFLQNQPTSFGDNVAGSFGNQGSDPAQVTTGVELAIPFEAIGLDPMMPAGEISMFAFINGSGHDFMANQALGGLTGASGNLGEPRIFDYSDPGLMADALVFTPAELGAGQAAPVIDGTADAIYGSAISGSVQNNFTGFGDADHGNRFRAGEPDPGSNGSEINAAFAVAKDGVLYLTLSGNLEANFNKLELFFDTVAGGQNQLRGDNPNVDFNGLNRMGQFLNEDAMDPDCDNMMEGFEPGCGVIADPGAPGLILPAGFEADYWFTVTGGNDPFEGFYSWASMWDFDDANGDGFADDSLPGEFDNREGFFIGQNFGFGDTPGETDPFTVGGDIPMGVTWPNNFNAAIDNSNTGGVGGQVINLPDPDISFGSEVNGVYGHIEGNTLFLLVTGNLETNNNSLDLFFDVRPGGQNSLRNDNVQIGVGPDDDPGMANGALNRLGTATIITPDPDDLDCIDPESPDCDMIMEVLPGLTFDAAFIADYYLSVNTAQAGLGVEQFAEAAVLRNDGRLILPDAISTADTLLDYGSFDGGLKSMNNPVMFDGGLVDAVGPLTGAMPVENLLANFAPQDLADQLIAEANASQAFTTPTGNAGLIMVSIDNNNVGGVNAFDDAMPDVSDAANVQTGVEIAIDLDELGWDGTSDIKVAGFINATNADFLANQVIGGLPDGMGGVPAGQLGDPRLVDFSMISGDQFVLIPAPAAACGPDITVDGACTPGVGDGIVTLSDFSCYLAQWAASLPIADVTLDGTCDFGNGGDGVTLSDFSCYLATWSGGCDGDPGTPAIRSNGSRNSLTATRSNSGAKGVRLR
ncbi:MAG: GC-type dockerin domain-anchored protein, partial [Planctomycetota bacterium]